jgi:hypothetical protein
MYQRKKFQLLKPKQEENNCDICGAPHALLGTITNDDGIIVDELSGFICHECLDVEDDYVEKLVDELNGNQKLKGQFAERFKKIRLKNKADFIGKYGLGVKHEKCEICGQDNSYLCVVEDHFKGHVEMWDELAGWFCADCITTGIHQTHMYKVLYEFSQFRKDCNDVKARYKTYMTMPCYVDEAAKQEASSNFESAIKRGIELEEQESVYKRKAESMEKARLAYEGTPVKIVIRTAKEGDLCSLCGKTYGKDCKCEDNKINLKEHFKSKNH